MIFLFITMYIKEEKIVEEGASLPLLFCARVVKLHRGNKIRYYQSEKECDIL